MLDMLWVCLGIVCLVVGIVGCIVPAIPGPALSYVALLLLLFTSRSVGAVTLIVGAVVALVAILLDYIVPAFGAKKFKCSRAGVIGCTIGSALGMFFMPLGLFLGPFLGAFVGEIWNGRGTKGAFVGGLGALVGFVLGVVVKIAACGVLALMFFLSACCGPSGGNTAAIATKEPVGMKEGR